MHSFASFRVLGGKISWRARRPTHLASLSFWVNRSSLLLGGHFDLDAVKDPFGRATLGIFDLNDHTI